QRGHTRVACTRARRAGADRRWSGAASSAPRAPTPARRTRWCATRSRSSSRKRRSPRGPRSASRALELRELVLDLVTQRRLRHLGEHLFIEVARLLLVALLQVH